MIKLLDEAIKLDLKDLIKNREWNSVDVIYEDPHVERLWIQYNHSMRLMLHKIYPCEKALCHPHPWPSAIKLLKGSYEMAIGEMINDFAFGKEVGKIILSEGSSYEMMNPRGWHYVRPIDEPSYSIMLIGKPWKTNIVQPGRNMNKPLSTYSKNKLMNEFKEILFQ